jgi:hypothetical protein
MLSLSTLVVSINERVALAIFMAADLDQYIVIKRSEQTNIEVENR